jgi:hypothetical protein
VRFARLNAGEGESWIMPKRKRGDGAHYNQSAVYPYEIDNRATLVATWKRLERSRGLGWPGSISIHGNLLKGHGARREAPAG